MPKTNDERLLVKYSANEFKKFAIKIDFIGLESNDVSYQDIGSTAMSMFRVRDVYIPVTE